MGYKRSDALPNAHKPTRPSNQGDPLRDLAGSLQETKHVYQSGVFEWVCALLMWAIIRVALLLIIGYATSPARADECDLAQTTRAMAECYGAVAKQSEKVMQSKFEQRLQRTPAYLRKALVTAQKQWIGLRDYRVVSANRGRWVGDFDCAGEGMTWTATYAISIRKGRLLMTTVRRSEDKPEAEPSDTKLPTATARRAVCVGPIEHYGHGSETNMRVWRHGPNGETVYDCEFESDTRSGKLIIRVCGPIIDVVDENLKLACRIEGLFEIHGGKVRMNLIRADNVELVRTGGGKR